MTLHEAIINGGTENIEIRDNTIIHIWRFDPEDVNLYSRTLGLWYSDPILHYIDRDGLLVQNDAEKLSNTVSFITL